MNFKLHGSKLSLLNFVSFCRCPFRRVLLILHITCIIIVRRSLKYVIQKHIRSYK